MNVRKAELGLKNEVINKLHNQDIKGKVFILLSYEILVNTSLNIPIRLAVKLVRLINKI